MMKDAHSLFMSFHKIPRCTESMRPLLNLGKAGQERSAWQAARSHVPDPSMLRFQNGYVASGTVWIFLEQHSCCTSGCTKDKMKVFQSYAANRITPSQEDVHVAAGTWKYVSRY